MTKLAIQIGRVRHRENGDLRRAVKIGWMGGGWRQDGRVTVTMEASMSVRVGNDSMDVARNEVQHTSCSRTVG